MGDQVRENADADDMAPVGSCLYNEAIDETETLILVSYGWYGLMACCDHYLCPACKATITPEPGGDPYSELDLAVHRHLLSLSLYELKEHVLAMALIGQQA